MKHFEKRASFAEPEDRDDHLRRIFGPHRDLILRAAELLKNSPGGTPQVSGDVLWPNLNADRFLKAAQVTGNNEDEDMPN